MGSNIDFIQKIIEKNGMVILFVLVAIVLVVLFFANRKKRNIRSKVKKQVAIEAKDFLDMWDELRGKDKPGCYVITIYKRKASKSELKSCRGFCNIYIGQSINVYRRVRNHLTGHGNGDVYADVKYGKAVYVRILMCSKQQLNYLEKELIDAYNATDSYNKTGGGAKIS